MTSAALSSPLPNVGINSRYGLGVGARLRLIGLLLAALSLGAGTLLVILAATGMSLALEFANFLLLAVFVFLLAGFCRFRRHDWRMADSANIVALVTVSLLLCGLVANIGLRMRFPIVDPLLARGDALIGLDARAVAGFVANQPLFSRLLHIAYNVSGPLCAAAVLWNLMKQDRVRLWQVVATLIAAMQLTALVSIFFPARGAAVTLGLGALQGRGLPFGAGTYAVPAFEHFYRGAELLVKLEDMNGIVCFPSFHTVMALAILQGFVASPFRWIALGWSALTIVSTVPLGGHYVTDLAGGILVWLVACGLAAWACRDFGSRLAT